MVPVARFGEGSAGRDPEATPEDGGKGVEAAPRTSAGAPAATEAAAALPLLVVTAVLGWWGWKNGAYFGVVFWPGAVVLFGLLGSMLLFAPLPGSLRGAPLVALVALFALSVWTAASAAWSPAPGVAIEDALRVFTYSVAFALGLWICLLLRDRMKVSLAPIAIAGGVVALATLAVLWVGDDTKRFLEEDATLRYPLGYRNAVAAFFLIALWPMIVLAGSREADWRLRGALIGTAALCIDLAVLAQSRSAVFAVAVGAVVLVAVHTDRLRMLLHLALAAIPAIAALPWLLDVFQANGADTAASLGPLHAACRAMAASILLGVLLGSAAAGLDRRVQVSRVAGKRIGWGLAVAAVLMAVVGTTAVLRAEGGLGGFLDRQEQDLTAGSPDLSGRGSRFGLDLRTERGDLWRVALDDFTAHPLYGEGGGGFRFSYLLDREETLQPEDPHSVVMLMASELGLPGLLLFGAFAVAATVGALRSRGRGPSAVALVTGSLAVAAYWLVHAGVEWFWSYPAITMPMAFVMGAAAAPAIAGPVSEPRRPVRIAAIAVLAAVAIAMLPLFLSERYTNQALSTGASDPQSAYDDAERAADLNPFSSRALASEAVIAEQAGDPDRALRALERAQERQPDEWTLYLLEARVVAKSDPKRAAAAIARVRALNPGATEIEQVDATLNRNREGGGEPDASDQ